MKTKTYKLDDLISVEMKEEIDYNADVVTTQIPILKNGQISFIQAQFQIEREKYGCAAPRHIVQEVVHKINESIKVVQKEYLESLIKEQNDLENQIVFP